MPDKDKMTIAIAGFMGGHGKQAIAADKNINIDHSLFKKLDERSLGINYDLGSYMFKTWVENNPLPEEIQKALQRKNPGTIGTIATCLPHDDINCINQSHLINEPKK